jgi:hypothetical protein
MIDQGRVLEIERRLNRVLRDLAALQAQIKEVSQALPRAWTNNGPSGDGGGGSLCWARTPSSVSAATGTWPSLTPSSFTADVYRRTGTDLALVKEDATIYWWYLDGADSGKLVPCVKNADGSYDAVVDSCTAVDLDEVVE